MAVRFQLFIFSSALFKEKLPVLTSRVYHLKYCKLLCMDLIVVIPVFPGEALVNKGRWESCVLYSVAGSLAVFGKLQRR